MSSQENPESTDPVSPGLLRVILSIIYDAVLVFGIVFFAATIIVIPAEWITGREDPFPPGSLASLLFFAYLLCAGIGFHIWFWTHGGQTLGMKTWRLKVTDCNLQPVDFTHALRRYAAASLSMLALGLGFLWILVDSEHRSWHDRLSATRLVMTTKGSSH